VTTLVEKIVAILRSLDAAGFGHAFGGALALAWCTQRARGTIDIDVNIFLPPDEAARALGALPEGVRVAPPDRRLVERDGQARLWWEGTPVDVFLNTTGFHDQVSTRCRRERFSGEELPFLACGDLAVFKAFFNRSRDWVDLEEMHDAGTLDIEGVGTVLAEYLGPDDERISRLRSWKVAEK
jgi:hypothetical protein